MFTGSAGGLEGLVGNAKPIEVPEAIETAATTIELPSRLDRRGFFRTGAGLILGGCASVEMPHYIPKASSKSIEGPRPPIMEKIEPDLRDLVGTLWEYVNGNLARDGKRAIPALNKLQNKYGFKGINITSPPDLNVKLKDYKLFLAKSGLEAYERGFNLFKVENEDKFDGFLVDGKKRDMVFGSRIGIYERFFLGDEIFSTNGLAHYGSVYNLGEEHRPRWAIALAVKNETPRRIQDITMHEVGHILFTRGRYQHELSEKIAYLVQLGYMFDGDDIKSPKDVAAYIQTKNPTFSKSTELMLDEIDKAKDGEGTHQTAKAAIGRGIIQQSGETYEAAENMEGLKVMPSRDLKKPIHPQVWAIAYLLFKEAKAEYDKNYRKI